MTKFDVAPLSIRVVSRAVSFDRRLHVIYRETRFMIHGSYMEAHTYGCTTAAFEYMYAASTEETRHQQERSS